MAAMLYLQQGSVQDDDWVCPTNGCRVCSLHRFQTRVAPSRLEMELGLH